MDKLNGMVCYLSGAMEAAKDGGVGWRQEFINDLKLAHLNIICIDPTNKPKDLDGKTVEEEFNAVKEFKEKEQWKELTEYVKKFRRFDLRFCDLSDCVVAYIDPSLHLCGTYNEIFEAERQKKPRFAIIKGGKKACPTWLFDVFDHDCMFDNISDCIVRLKDLNSGKIPLNDKWVLIRNYI